MRERITIGDIENSEAVERQAAGEAKKIATEAGRVFLRGANTYEYTNRTSDYQEDAGRSKGLSKMYAERVADLVRSEHPEWEVNLVEVIGQVSTGRDESEETHDGYDIEVIKA